MHQGVIDTVRRHGADSVAALTELLLVTFYTGREHAVRGYAAPAGRSLDDIPDTVEALLTPDLHHFHVEFHCDVTASNAETAIAALHGDDWRVTRLD